MTPRANHHRLHRLLAKSHQLVLRAWIARFALRGAAIAVGAIAVAVLLGVLLPSGVAIAWVRLALVAAVCVVGVAFAVKGYRAFAPRFASYLEAVEARFPEIKSWLRNAVDFESGAPQNTSPELVQALSSETERRVAKVPLTELVPSVEARRPMLVLGAAFVAIVGLGLIAPSKVTRSWLTLWNPALAAQPVELMVEPGSVRITPGAALTVRARVWGTSQRPLLARDGEPDAKPKDEGRGPDGARVWRFDLTQLTRDQDYLVRVAGVSSERYRIALAGEPMPVGFEIEYRAPDYARLPIQRGGATRGDLSALRGTRAKVEVTFDRDLESLDATLPGGFRNDWTSLTARRWEGEIAIDTEGEYTLHARARQGEDSFTYRITPLPDSPPLLMVHVPYGDVDLPAGQQIPIEISAQDDLGLSELKLQYRKESTQPWSDVPLARFAAEPREAEVRKSWDASPLGLLPGEIATFRFVLYDNNRVSGRGMTTSPEYELRFPSLADLYEDIDRSQGNVQEKLEDVAKQARELQESLDKLARQQPPSPTQKSPSFERSAEAKKALERQQELGKKIDQAAQELRSNLEKAAERDAYNEELMRKLQELNKLMDQIQSEEFREAMQRLQQALENLDQNQLDQNLQQWQSENKDMLEQLERNIELLKQLRQEEQLDALARRAEELKQRQDALNREHESREQQKEHDAESLAEDRSLAEQQDQAAKDSEKLSEDARELGEKMQEKSAADELEKAADQLEKDAAQQQRESAESTRQDQHSQAKKKGEEASETLDRVAQSLQKMSDEMREMRQGIDLATIRRAAKDLVSLQRETEGNLGSDQTLDARADRQTDLSEGVSRVADSLYALSLRTPFISKDLALSLGHAIDHLQDSGREMARGNRARGEASGRDGSSSINRAVLELRNSEDSMCKSPGGSGGEQPGQLSEKMGEIGDQQSQLNRDSRSLAKRLSEQMRLQAGDREQMQRMADEQRRIREQLEQVEKDDEIRRELLGRLDGTKRDMKEVEETLRQGRSDPELEQKQQRILSRLLDAQRSVNRRDFNPERESRPGEDLGQASPPELSQDLMRETDRLRHDLLKAEGDRYPAQYRAFIESYLRALNRSRR